MAVVGFFGISGYLITGSAERSRPLRYLWQRFLRIFPAFWVCLVVTAFVIGAIAWSTDPAVAHCGMSCYFDAPRNSPMEYVFSNALLRLHQNVIVATPPFNWNASIWTLFFEFCCYVLILIFAVLGALRHRWSLLLATAVVWIGNSVITFTPSLSAHFNIFVNRNPMSLIKLSAVFLVGACLYVYRDVVPDSGWIVLGCTALILADLFIPTHGKVPDFYFSPSNLALPLMAYPLIWLGIHLPLQRVGAENDYSYGFYLYGWPASQLLALWGLTRWGVIPYLTTSVVVAGCFAVASWWLVERHALRLKHRTLKLSALWSDPIRG